MIPGSPSSSVSCTVAGDPSTPENTAEPLDNTQNTVRLISLHFLFWDCWKQCHVRTGKCCMSWSCQSSAGTSLTWWTSSWTAVGPLPTRTWRTGGGLLELHLHDDITTHNSKCFKGSATPGTTTPSTPGSGTTQTAQIPASPTRSHQLLAVN